MTLAPAARPLPGRRGPKTPEGKARSAMNAVRHGLRSRGFALLPEEDLAEWAEHLAELRRDLGPVDPTEEKLVAALAVAMWKEIRADRTEAGVLTRMTDEGALGRDLGDKRNALSLGTAIRYGTAAGMATQRAHRAFLAHRRAKQKGLLVPATAAEPVECTNDLTAGAIPCHAESKNCTNELPPTPLHPPADPLIALRARTAGLIDGTALPETAARDLALAIQAVRLSGAAPYQGQIDLKLLDCAFASVPVDAATFTWPETMVPSPTLLEGDGSSPLVLAA
jgi:hypothetical protein